MVSRERVVLRDVTVVAERQKVDANVTLTPNADRTFEDLSDGHLMRAPPNWLLHVEPSMGFHLELQFKFCVVVKVTHRIDSK